ncbi:hypothetical protein EVAR_85669_1 [Eumeta japonica]|uniref:Uncharacterized protein n=1 Tax=Eumeta variegata TaxID=151549 RepID=A0A4C1WD52_EUMVA|nr:hypothetical protein EVAR_85669_1 [Eumeta japonica]
MSQGKQENFISRIVTCDETWIRQCDPETYSGLCITHLAREKCRNPVFHIFLEQSRTSPGDAAQVRPRHLCSKTLQGARKKEHDAQAPSTFLRPLQRKHRRVQNTSRCPDKPNKEAFSDDRRMTEYMEHPCPPSTPHAPQTPILRTKELAVCIRTALTPRPRSWCLTLDQ